MSKTNFKKAIRGHFPYRSTASTYMHFHRTYQALKNNIFEDPRVQLFQSLDFLDKKTKNLNKLSDPCKIIQLPELRKTLPMRFFISPCHLLTLSLEPLYFLVFMDILYWKKKKNYQGYLLLQKQQCIIYLSFIPSSINPFTTGTFLTYFSPTIWSLTLLTNIYLKKCTTLKYLY